MPKITNQARIDKAAWNDADIDKIVCPNHPNAPMFRHYFWRAGKGRMGMIECTVTGCDWFVSRPHEKAKEVVIS